MLEQAAALNPQAASDVRKNVGQMSPEEMIDTLNVYINKAKQEDKTPKQVKNEAAEEFGEKN